MSKRENIESLIGAMRGVRLAILGALRLAEQDSANDHEVGETDTHYNTTSNLRRAADDVGSAIETLHRIIRE